MDHTESLAMDRQDQETAFNEWLEELRADDDMKPESKNQVIAWLQESREVIIANVHSIFPEEFNDLFGLDQDQQDDMTDAMEEYPFAIITRADMDEVIEAFMTMAQAIEFCEELGLSWVPCVYQNVVTTKQ